MKKRMFYDLLTRLRWILRRRTRRQTPTDPENAKDPIPLARILLLAFRLWNLLRLLISLIRRNWGGSAKN